MAAMLLIAVQEIENIETINLKFLVSGHSEMECDSMHSAIDREFKRVGKALWPADWQTIAKSARRKGDKPYIVHQLKINQINDYKEFVKQKMCFRKKDEKGLEVNWQKMCWLRFRSTQPFIMEFKQSFNEEFRLLNVNKTNRRNSQPASHLQPLYKDPNIPISEEKYKSLISLFTLKPQSLDDLYKPFYYNLPHTGSVQDTISDSEDEETQD
ncbi:dna-directed rna polymerases i ii and iii subunit rpabc2 [Holotrichia oblita]|uniref:Dna-directed rna polymerases i ii and iii subunit rpabc2 n=1 Tax=Holotrichia oblita TaxID=644536 RepID=A0ACB9TFT4_HOLOL|nr:dna-directed rna polymerases i ii and iii subunit rpabc2 [Holotrichia oblita]